MEGFIWGEDLLELASKLENAQDSFILIALYEGICGKDYSDIRNLKFDDIDTNNLTVKLGEKTIEISPMLKDIAISANNQVLYKSLINPSEECVLNANSPYVLKTKRVSENPISIGGFRTRFDNIIKLLGVELTTQNIVDSGIVDSLLSLSPFWTVAEVEIWLKENSIKTSAYRIYKLLKSVKNNLV